MAKRLKLEYMGVNQLMPLEGNPRKLIDEDGVAKLKKLIAKHGFQNPLQVYKEKNGRYSILCGNHRFEAGIAIGLKEFPCFVYTGSREMATARAISDNKSSNWTDWELPLLKDSLAELDTGDFDIELTGWTESEIAEMFDYGEVTELEGEDSVPDAPEEAITQVGDLYQLGEHRLLCGDSTAQSAVETLMDGQKADMVFTDPPYGVDYTGKTKDALKIKNDQGLNVFPEAVKNLPLKGGEAVYVCCPAGNNFIHFEEVFQTNCHHSCTIIWNKNSMVLGRGDYHYKHEPILYGWKLGGTHKFYGDRTQTTVWDIERPTVSKEHPTMKPIGLIEKAVVNSSTNGNAVYDPFGGSGSTMIACEKLNRKCYMMELDPKYCDVIVGRYKNLFPDQTVKLLNRKEELAGV